MQGYFANNGCIRVHALTNLTKYKIDEKRKELFVLKRGFCTDSEDVSINQASVTQESDQNHYLNFSFGHFASSSALYCGL